MPFRDIPRTKRLLEAANREQSRTHKPNKFYRDLHQALRNPETRPDNEELSRASIRDIFEAVVPDGPEILRSWSPNKSGGGVALLEAPNAVQTTDFSNIMGQLVFSAMMNEWEGPQYIGDQLVTTVPSDMLDEELIPGITGIGDAASVHGPVDEGESFPLAGVSEEYVTAPKKRKRGFIVPVTKETTIFDKTGLVVTRASAVSKALAINKEKRIIDMVLGSVTSYRRNGAAAIATYSDTAGGFDNVLTSALTSELDIDDANQLMNDLTDPNTGEPIVVSKPILLVPKKLERTAHQILNATEIRTTSDTSTVTLGGKFLDSGIQLISSPYVYVQGQSHIIWYYGDFKKAFTYHEVWPILAEQAPQNSEAQFSNDIVSRFKVSEMGAVGVMEPRYVVKSTGAA